MLNGGVYSAVLKDRKGGGATWELAVLNLSNILYPLLVGWTSHTGYTQYANWGCPLQTVSCPIKNYANFTTNKHTFSRLPYYEVHENSCTVIFKKQIHCQISFYLFQIFQRKHDLAREGTNLFGLFEGQLWRWNWFSIRTLRFLWLLNQIATELLWTTVWISALLLYWHQSRQCSQQQQNLTSKIAMVWNA